jgi:hypothetical protein
MAYNTPCVQMRYHTCVEKLEARCEKDAICKPITDETRRNEGRASRASSEKGAKRYMTPVEQVPITGIPFEFSENGE